MIDEGAPESHEANKDYFLKNVEFFICRKMFNNSILNPEHPVISHSWNPSEYKKNYEKYVGTNEIKKILPFSRGWVQIPGSRSTSITSKSGSGSKSKSGSGSGSGSVIVPAKPIKIDSSLNAKVIEIFGTYGYCYQYAVDKLKRRTPDEQKKILDGVTTFLENNKHTKKSSPEQIDIHKLNDFFLDFKVSGPTSKKLSNEEQMLRIVAFCKKIWDKSKLKNKKIGLTYGANVGHKKKLKSVEKTKDKKVVTFNVFGFTGFGNIIV